MSVVKIQGNASGTGEFTISAPNSNTNRTLTLPDATGTVQVSGAAISGTTGTFTGLVDISAAGAGQIQFPATQNASSNANTLDDYEEGTFTPTITGQTTAGTTTYNTQSGFYTKVGRLVTVNISLYWTAMTGTGDVNIGGLPFPSANLAANFTGGPCMTVGLNWTQGTQLSTFMANNSSIIKIYCSGDDIAGAYQQCVNETAEVYFSFSYITAT